MPRIRVIPYDESSGLLRAEYDAALGRAGRIWNIVSIMSPNARVLRASMAMYKEVMYGPSELSRGQREMLATVVSAINHCVY